MSSGGSWDIANGKSLGSAIKDSWYMITLTRNGNTFTAYRNATQTDTWTSSLALKNAVSPIEIGRTQGTYFHKGKIDDVRIYNRALSSSEIITLYNSTYGTEAELIINSTNITITTNNTLDFGDTVLLAKGFNVHSELFTGDANNLISKITVDREDKSGALFSKIDHNTLGGAMETRNGIVTQSLDKTVAILIKSNQELIIKNNQLQSQITQLQQLYSNLTGKDLDLSKVNDVQNEAICSIKIFGWCIK